MANSELYDKTFTIPSDILKGINAALVSNPNGEGVKRAKYMVKNGNVTYQAMKRMKNFFDYFSPENGDVSQYNLAGGEAMKTFIEQTLAAERNAVQTGKDVRQDVKRGTNQIPDIKSAAKPDVSAIPNVNEGKEKKKKEKLQQNAIAVIVNSDNKILLVKRSDYPDQWMPEKWSLVGGRVEKGEKHDVACRREIKEETNLDVSKFVESFKIKRQKDSEETVFACRYDGDDTDVELDMKENVKYGWYSVSEMEYLDIVPHLIEYITLVFKKYE